MILGTFYLRRTSNGNLFGEYTNTSSDIIFTESADFLDENDGVRRYNSTYFDEGGQARRLEISRHITNPDALTLQWFRKGDNTPQFRGFAFINSEMNIETLIGTYWDDDLDEVLGDNIRR